MKPLFNLDIIKFKDKFISIHYFLYSVKSNLLVVLLLKILNWTIIINFTQKIFYLLTFYSNII